MTTSIKIVGVGGQGTILASKILMSALLNEGFDVKMSEIHGMSQRGGSVSSELRFGKNVHSPVIEKGAADIILAFEKMEALRYLDYLKPDGNILINDLQINSMVTLSGEVPYPKGIIDYIEKHVDTLVIHATKEAMELGNAKAMNTIMLGALANKMDLVHLDFKRAMEEHIKPKYIDLNKKAFNIGLTL